MNSRWPVQIRIVRRAATHNILSLTWLMSTRKSHLQPGMLLSAFPTLANAAVALAKKHWSEILIDYSSFDQDRGRNMAREQCCWELKWFWLVPPSTDSLMTLPRCLGSPHIVLPAIIIHWNSLLIEQIASNLFTSSPLKVAVSFKEKTFVSPTTKLLLKARENGYDEGENKAFGTTVFYF